MGSEPREFRDPDGITWTCIQVFAGLGNGPEKQAAARIEGSNNVEVVCTPSGAARSRRLGLPPDWEGMTDNELLAALRAAGETCLAHADGEGGYRTRPISR